MQFVGYNRLGDWLMQSGVLQSHQLRAALDEQARSGRRLGDILVAFGWATERQVVECLAAQYNLPLLPEGRPRFQRAALQVLSPLFCLAHLVLPIRFEPKTQRLVLALSDPLDLAATDEISQALPDRPELILAPSSEIRRLTVSAYRLPPSMLDPIRIDPCPEKSEAEALPERQILIGEIQRMNSAVGFWERLAGGRL
jgi:type IV pilus assembly protein PilB